MNKIAHTIARNSMLGMVAQLGVKALSFLFTVFVVRNLGPEVYGQYNGVLAFGGVFAIFGDLGLSAYSIREVARLRDEPDGPTQITQLFSNVVVLRLLLSVATAGALVFTAWLTGRPANMIVAIALGTIGLMLYGFEGATESILSGHERFDVSSVARVVNQLIFVLLGAVFMWAGAGYFGLIFSSLAGVLVMTLWCWHGARRLGIRLVRPQFSVWGRLLKASLPFAVIGFALGLSYKFDSVLLNLFRGDKETGLYGSVYNLVFNAVILSNVFNTALYPTLVRHAKAGQTDLSRIYGRAFGFLAAISLPIAAGMWAISDQLVDLLFGSQYASATTALSIIVWAIPLMFASEFLGYIVVISGKERYVARAVVTSTIFNVLVNLVVVPSFGFVGASVMTVVTEAVLVGQYVWYLRGFLGGLDLGRVLGRPVGATLLMAGVVWISHSYLPLAVSVASGVVVFGACFWAVGGVGQDEIQLVRSLFRRPAPTGTNPTS